MRKVRWRQFLQDGNKYSASRLLLIWIDMFCLPVILSLCVYNLLPAGEMVKLILGLNATLCGVYAVNTWRKRNGTDVD